MKEINPHIQLAANDRSHYILFLKREVVDRREPGVYRVVNLGLFNVSGPAVTPGVGDASAVYRQFPKDHGALVRRIAGRAKQ